MAVPPGTIQYTTVQYMDLGLEYNNKMAVPPGKIQYSIVHESMIIRVHQHYGGSSRSLCLHGQCSTVQDILWLEYNKNLAIPPGTIQYSTVQYMDLGLEYTNMMAVPPGTIQYSTRNI